MIDNQFIKKPSGFNKQRLDSFIKSVKTNKQDVQKKELDEALALHTQLVAQDMMQRAMQLPAFPDLQQAYINQGMQQMQPMQRIPQAAYGMEIGAVMPSINSPFTYPSQQNLTPPNSDMFKKNADKYAGKGMSAFKNLFTTAANAVLNPAIQEYNQKVYNAKQKDAADEEDVEETDVPGAKLGGDLIKAQKVGELNGDPWEKQLMRGIPGYSPAPRPPVKQNLVGDVRRVERPTAVASTTRVATPTLPANYKELIEEAANSEAVDRQIAESQFIADWDRKNGITPQPGTPEYYRMLSKTPNDPAGLQSVPIFEAALMGPVALSTLSAAFNAPLFGTGVSASNILNPLFKVAGVNGFVNPNSDFRQTLSDYNNGEAVWQDVALQGALNSLNFLGSGSLLNDFKAFSKVGSKTPAVGAQLFGDAQAFEKVPFKSWESKGLPAKEAVVTESDFWKTADLKKTVTDLKNHNKEWDDLYSEYEAIDADLAKRGIKTDGTPNAINNLYPELKVKFDKLVANKPAAIGSKTLTTEQEKYLKDLLLPAEIDNTIPYFRGSYGPQAFANSISKQDWSPLKSNFKPTGTIEDLFLRHSQNKNINDILDANIDISKIKDPLATVNIDGVTYKVGDILDFKNRGYNYGLTPRKFFWNQKGGNIPTAKMGGDLIKAEGGFDVGDALKAAYEQAMANLRSDEPVYNEAGDLIDKDQLQQAAQEAYNRYYQGINEAYKNNPSPNWGSADFSYLNQYPTMPSLEMPGYNLSGQGVAPELHKGIAAAQMYNNMQPEYPGLGRYFGLSPQKKFEINDVNYSPNYKEMYNDALGRGEYDRFETNIEADPTLAGRALDKIGIGKLFSTRNYNVTENILPRGESVLDPERLAETQRKQTLLKNANSPAGGLFETDQITPDLWQNISRRQRRELLNEADIDPNRKNLRGMGRKFLANEAAEIAAERGPAPRPNGINIPGMVMPVDISGIQTDNQTPTPSITKLPSASAPKGSNPTVPAPAVTGQTNTTPPPVTTTQSNVVTPNPATTPKSTYTPPAFDLGRTQNQIVKTEGEWFGTKPAGLALPDNYDKDWRNYAVDKSAGPFMYPTANKVEQDWNTVMAKDPKKKAMWESFNDMPAPIREIAADQVFNAGYDPRVMVLGAAGVDKGYTGKGSPVTSNPEYRRWLKTNADQLWKDNKDLINQQYADDPQAFTSSITDNRKIIYKNLRTEDLPGGVLTDFPSNSGGPGTQYNAWSGRSGAVQDYVDQTYFDPSTGYTAPQYFKKKGGSQLPSFKGEYGPSTFGGPGFGGPNPFGISPNWFNNFDLAIGLKTDNPLMAGTQDDVLNYNGFDYTKNGLPSGYIGANEDKSSLATATGKGKLTGNIAPTTYLTIGNAAGKFLADSVFGRDERKNAEKEYRKSRFLENNLALTSADTQFDPRLRGFDRATDAFGGAPYAGAQVQYGQPLIAMAQQGTQIPMTMQEGGVYTLTPEMIKQIIDNGGEVEYVDNSNNFVNPFNQ